MSFIEKYTWNGILSLSDIKPKGFLDPVKCNKVIWIITKAKIMKGMIKWKVKNRVIVGLSTETPPQISWTKLEPIYGTSVNKFVMTEAPQNDIWLTGRT